MKILNVEPENYSEKAKEILIGLGNVVEMQCDKNELLKAVKNVDVLIVRLGHKIDEEVFLSANKLKAVVTATTGLNHIDLNAANHYGVRILSLKGERDFLDTLTATAELTWSLLLGLIRQIPAASLHVKSGGWDRDQFRGYQLQNKVLGIVGFGRLGSIVAEYGRAFKMKIIVTDPFVSMVPSWVEKVELDELLSRSDVVSLHVNYNDDNHQLLSHKEFSKIKKKAVLINTSRGEIINEEAMLDALTKGVLAGVALDVLDGEAEKKKDWLIKNKLWKYAKNNKNMIIVPHIGGATVESMEQTEIFMANKLREYFKDKK